MSAYIKIKSTMTEFGNKHLIFTQFFCRDHETSEHEHLYSFFVAVLFTSTIFCTLQFVCYAFIHISYV